MTVPYRRIDDVEKLRRLLDAVLMIEADLELPALLHLFVHEACALVDARYGALGVLNEARTNLEQFVTIGLSDADESLIGERPSGRGVLGLLITEPSTLRLTNLTTHPDSYGFPAHHPPMTSFLGVTVRVRDEVYGNLYLTDKMGASDFSEEDTALAEALAVAAGIAIENRRLHDRVRLMSVLDDRDRIARDLHDRVIQRVFAIGLTLQEATRSTDLDAVVAQVNRSVDELDTTISEIRTAIYELGADVLPGGLRHSVVELTSEMSAFLGSRAELTFHGPIDNAIPQRIADNVLAVLREALTNAGKHAKATRFVVTLTLTDHVTLEVIDDGAGFPGGTVHEGALGLANMRSRAQKLGGVCSVTPSDMGGTRVTWRVPV